MRRVEIPEIIRAEAEIAVFSKTDPTNHSYREFVEYFRSKSMLSPHDITVGAYMAYGWMPTGLNHFDVNALEKMTGIINRAKQGAELGPEEMKLLCQSINHSLVGPSKLLHFVNPTKFAIWDSRVIRFIKRQDPSVMSPEPRDSEKKSIPDYRDYLGNLTYLVEQPVFQQVHDSMNRKIGYGVTPFRACEYVMYVAGRDDNQGAGRVGRV